LNLPIQALLAPMLARLEAGLFEAAVRPAGV